MKILTNDYEANLPGSKKTAHGGPANFAKKFAKACQEAGHTYTGVVFIENGESEYTTKVALKKPKKIVINIPGGWTHTLMQTRSQKELHQLTDKLEYTTKQILLKERPDLIFINGFSAKVACLIRAAYNLQIPTVIQHAGISYLEVEVYKHLYSKTAFAFMRSVERELASKISHHIFLNQHSYKAFTKLVTRVPKAKTSIIPLPFDVLNPHKTPLPNRPIKHLGIVARWDRIKNHAAILALAKEIKAQKLPWKIHSITKIPETPVQKRFKDSYRKHVIIEPPRPNQELVAFYQNMDLLLLPSHFDVSPFVVMEAITEGRGTLISPAVGWVDHYQATGNKDWIIDFSNPKKVVNRIKKLIGTTLSNQFLQSLKQKHQPNKIFKKYFTLFKSLT